MWVRFTDASYAMNTGEINSLHTENVWLYHWATREYYNVHFET